MGEFNYFDLISAGIILASAYLAYIRGIVREIMAIAVWVIAAAVAYFSAPFLYPYMSLIPVIGELLRDSCQLATIAAFTVGFSIAVIVLTVVTAFLVRLGNLPVINIVNRGAGIVFGVLRGVIVVGIVLAVNEGLFDNNSVSSTISESRSASALVVVRDVLMDSVPDRTPDWLEAIYQNAMAVCDTDRIEA